MEVKPEIRIVIVDTEKKDNVGYLKKCLKAPNGLPYIDDLHGNLAPLVIEYDQDTRQEIKPGGLFRAKFEDRLNDLAQNLKSNIIYWSSENTLCKEFKDVSPKINPIIKEIKKINKLPIVVILAACRTYRYAHIYNTSERRNDYDTTIFIGFQDQIHRYEDNVFDCFYAQNDYPSVTCNSETMGNALNDEEIQLLFDSDTGQLKKEARNDDRELVKCCIARVDGFKKFFIDSLKSKRTCTKISWDKIKERIKSLQEKVKTGVFTEDDCALRGYNPEKPEKDYNGTYCLASEEKPNPCNINNRFNNSASKEYNTKISPGIRKWGELMADLRYKQMNKENTNYGTNGSKFKNIIETIGDEEAKKLVNKVSRNDDTALSLVLKNDGIPVETKTYIVQKLLDLGADTNYKTDTTSILKLLTSSITNNPNNIISMIILNTKTRIDKEYIDTLQGLSPKAKEEIEKKISYIILSNIVPQLKVSIKTKEQKENMKVLISHIDSKYESKLTSIMNVQGKPPQYDEVVTQFEILRKNYDTIKKAINDIAGGVTVNNIKRTFDGGRYLKSRKYRQLRKKRVTRRAKN